ncbi:MAG: hypothetical protein QOJ98_1792 [Acidobacteriota bacterium]|jgi:hypothetical protein|nr:hypothetical protein [Acidobacteriota bacterium]
MLVRRIKSVVVLMSLVACSQLIGAPAAAPADARHDVGNVLIFNQGLNSLVVAMDTEGKDGLVDQWFVLQTLAPVAETRVHVRLANVHFREGLLRVISRPDQTAYEFALDGAGPGSELPPGYRVVRSEGYGLSRNVGETTLMLPSKDKRTCDTCESLEQDWGEIGGGGGGSYTCLSGGAGATKCSYTSGSKSCSVECMSGSYACCGITAAGAVRCSCVF